ncbi:hypothetical protein DFQ29_005671 [Apophysomyces sp. BC1021]|nr:hypothetical protein DFQ29_005671 [Apophysomyces sp. BC1021]
MTAQCNLSIKQAQFQPVERNSEEKIQQRYEWVQKWQQTDLDFATNCVFLDESAFHINLKRGAISATGLINVSLRVPKRIKKRKLGHEADTYSTGTVTGHYLSFLKATLDEMDRYPEMKGHYLVMDNAPIHSSTDIDGNAPMEVSDDDDDDGIRLETLTTMDSYLAWQKKGDEQLGTMELDKEGQQ